MGGSLTIATARRIISAFGVALFAIACVLVVTGRGASASTDFRTFSAPLTGAADFAVNFPTEPFFLSTIGPLGLLDDGTNFFVSDYADSTLYRFPVTGGDATTVPSAKDGLEDLALVNGTYFATMTQANQIVTFDPSTLALGTTAIPLHCSGRGLSGDPLTGNLVVSTACGVFRVKDPLSPSATVKRFSGSKDAFDGAAFSPTGQALWVADTTTNTVIEFDRRGHVLATIADPHGADGIVFTQPDTTLGGVDISNNVFVNNTDGTIIRIDGNNSNQVTLVAGGGTRGDFAIAGADGCFYATQSDRVERIEPCFFNSTGPSTTTTSVVTTTTAPPTTTAPTTTAPTTTVPPTTTTVAPRTAPTSAPTTSPPVVSVPSRALAFTGPGTALRWTAVVGFVLAVLGLGLLLFAQTPWSTRALEWLLGRPA